MTVNVLKVLIPSIVSFVIGVGITPIVTHYLYKYKMWKKKSVQNATGGGASTITSQIHDDEKRKVPRMGGIVVWGTTLITTLIFAFLSSISDSLVLNKLNFLSREQVWVPLFTLIAGAICGFVDDYLVCEEKQEGSYAGGGLSLKVRLLFVGLLGTFCAYWFYHKLGMSSFTIPFFGDFDLGFMFIPVFIMYVIGMYSGGIIDGVDGLAGGVFATIYTALSIIAFTNNQFNIAAFCAVIVGGLLAFLWFNIPPARFFMSETGTMGLTVTLVVVAFLINAEFVTLIISLPLIITALSSALQILSKKLRNGKKIFKVAPLHNHFQAIGWPPYKVTMRYWVISMILAVGGVIIQLAAPYL